MYKNRLADEKSPYLLQHASNPVDWYPWGEEAFEKAKSENKPIFLSIGYSTCHWCHVMEHESFEDSEVAKLMNDAFVCIKVDREERPDIDNIYMTAARLSTGGGGWPLTIIMTPDRKPFFTATYIPRDNRYGNLGMMELIPKIKEIWSLQKGEVLRSAERFVEALQDAARYKSGDGLDEKVLDSAFEHFEATFDSRFGGFGQAPKFPTPHNLMFLMRYWKRSDNHKAIEMAEKTLREMRKGGVYDHLGYGFHRYSTDPQWLLPHFEKMLYDQALLAMAYLETYQATGKDEYAQAAREIFEYVLRDMTDPGGGFYSAEDADSEGEEGKFYVWTIEEIKELLGKDDAEIFIKVYGFEEEGNFAEQATGRKTGDNIIHLEKSWAELAEGLNLKEDELLSKMNAARKKLFDIRKKRIHPHKDDKILTDWNGLMIAALAMGGRILDELDYENAAIKAADFVLCKMRDTNGELLHRYRDGESAIKAHLDDYAFLIWGLIELYQTGFDIKYLEAAIELNREMIDLFYDEESGGLFLSQNASNDLIVRQKEIYDGATPSGNSVAAYNFLRLARITADTEFEKKSEEIITLFSSEVKKAPSNYAMLLNAVNFEIGPSFEIVISGKEGSEDTIRMLRALNSEFIPNKVVIFRPDEETPEILRIAGYTENQKSIDGKATAYVCRNYACSLPTTESDEMLGLINQSDE
ncbi:MAG: thioredoxin domain-containing protein [Candidatus Zixiibacteriota bacterium]|nr:MAG: thioredoxin domain-containing protein [candidate division Zixibacteria bacterium]